MQSSDTPETLDGSIFGEGQPCFGCAPDHPIGFRLRFTREGDDVVTRFTPTERYQGPPGIMHGGLVSTLADEVAAWSVITLLGKFGFTGSMEGRFKSPIRIGAEVEARARITRPGSRVVGIEVRLTQNGTEVYDGKFRFVLLDRAGAEKMLDGPLPEAWEKFAR